MYCNTFQLIPGTSICLTVKEQLLSAATKQHLQPVAKTTERLAQERSDILQKLSWNKSEHTMTQENIVQENLHIETITSNDLKDRLENILEEINKKDGEHVIALVHPKLPNSCLQKSTKLKRPKKVTVTPHQKKTFCSPRLGRCPHCRKRADVSKLPEKKIASSASTRNAAKQQL